MSDPTPCSPRSRWRDLPLLAVLAPALVLALLCGGCGGDEADPVADLTASPSTVELPYGTYRDLTLEWSTHAEFDGLEGAPRLFLHLLDDEGELVRTFDQDFPGAWRAGREASQEARIYQSLLAPPLPPGTYTLTAGLYDAAGNRWALGGLGGPVAEREYRLATVEVPSGSSDLPAITFSPAWSPNQAGGDRQVVAFRTLAGEGAVAVSDLPGPGTLWLEVRIPTDGADGLVRRGLDSEEGAAGPAAGGDGDPRVTVVSSCGGFESRISGEGSHRIEVPLEAGGEGSCQVTLQPSFVMESPGGDRRSVNLEVLAWSDR
jgi:hypothetical protein